jgi:hypothetical protein
MFMVRRDGAEIRKERIQEIARLVQRLLHSHGEISFSKTLATFQYEFGLTKEKLTEYLEILEGLGQFILDKEHDKICSIKEG